MNARGAIHAVHSGPSARTVRSMASLAVVVAMATTAPAWAGSSSAMETATKAGPDSVAKVSFDPAMLAGGAANGLDLARFGKGITVMPGMYDVDVYLNKSWVGRMNVRLAAPDPNANAVPCFTPDMFERMHLTAQLKAADKARLAASGTCVQLHDVIPGAHARFDLSNLRLDTTVPQALLGDQPRGWVDPSSWDAGIPAFALNYRFNAYHTSNYGVDQDNAFLGLDMGVNIGLWHLRQDSTLSWYAAQNGAPSQREWHNIDAYARRDLPSIRSTLTLGDSYTDGAVFDSYAVHGVQLASNDQMLPQSRRGYAPVVRGTAQSNAQVTVRQNGVLLYQTTVPPGPFVLDDLYPTGYGGDLEVTVTEADGRQHSFSVPYASVAQLQRAGVTRYDVTAGQLRNLPGDDHPNVVQGTVQHGFNNLFTGYTGFQLSDDYAAVLVGGAFNTNAGAFALDLTQARSTVSGQHSDGRSVRLTWSKVMTDSDTRIAVAAYRHSTSGFLSLSEATQLAAWEHEPYTAAQQQPWYQRNGFTLTLSQPLGASGGQLFANVAYHDYWHGHGSDTNYQLGYNNQFRRLSYGLSVARTRDEYGRDDTRITLNFSIPLGSSPHAPTFMANLDHDTAGGMQEQAMLNGSAGRYNQFNYGATVSHDDDGGTAASVNAGYRAPWAVLGASYGTGNGYSQASFNMNGAVVAHAGGVTFGQPMGDTVALVHAPGAAGAHVENAPGVTVNDDGYALVPYLTPYQMDTIRLDPQGLPLGVQLASTSANVAPYDGAVVQVDFKTQYGRAVIATITLPNGKLAPFGTQVLDAKGDTVGVVGQGGRALLRVHHDHGRLHLDAFAMNPEGCAFSYVLPTTSAAYASITATCTRYSRATDNIAKAKTP